MFYPTEYGYLLMGAMFLKHGGHGEQFAGPLTVWHNHLLPGMCYDQYYVPVGAADKNGSCRKGVTREVSAEMIHVWYFNHPEGDFATTMKLPEIAYALAKKEMLDHYRVNGYSHLLSKHKIKM